MQVGTIDLDKLRGLADKGVGLLKEVVGTVIANDRLAAEGEAQQAKAAEQLKALRKQVDARRKQARAKAEPLDRRERVAPSARAS